MHTHTHTRKRKKIIILNSDVHAHIFFRAWFEKSLGLILARNSKKSPPRVFFFSLWVLAMKLFLVPALAKKGGGYIIYHSLFFFCRWMIIFFLLSSRFFFVCHLAGARFIGQGGGIYRVFMKTCFEVREEMRHGRKQGGGGGKPRHFFLRSVLAKTWRVIRNSNKTICFFFFFWGARKYILLRSPCVTVMKGRKIQIWFSYLFFKPGWKIPSLPVLLKAGYFFSDTPPPPRGSCSCFWQVFSPHSIQSFGE